MNKTITSAILQAALLSGATAAFASPMDALGRELATAAHRAGFQRLAVAGFEPARGKDAGRGAELDERMTVSLLKSGAVQVVERGMVPKLMAEHAFERSGAVEPPAPVRLATAQALVMGRYLSSARGTRLVARLVELRTGLVVAAGEADLDAEDGAEAPVAATSAEPAPRPAPSRFAALNFESGEEAGCAGATARIDSLEESVLELKARYWGARLRKGAVAGSDPAGTISDPGLRARFQERLDYWRERRASRLTPDEVKAFIEADGKAHALKAACAA